MLNLLARYGDRHQAYPKVSMKERQVPLTSRYVNDSDAAIIVDSARTSSTIVPAMYPLQSEVAFCDENPTKILVGVHENVGGDSDDPTPGDILCGAIAACLDSTIRIISNRFRIRLKYLEVEVFGTVDVRGTLRIDKTVPVAFQKFEVNVTVKPAGFVPDKFLDKLLAGAEQSCVVIQTLRHGVEIIVTRT